MATINDSQSQRFIDKALQPISYRDEQGQVKVIDPRALLTFDKNNIHFEQHANDYYLIARLTERTRLEFKDYQQQVDTLHANLYFEYSRNEKLRQMNGNRKPSENMIENAISQNSKYRAVLTQLNELESRYRQMQYLLKALETKASMMISASAEQRSLNKMTPTNSVGEY